MSRVAKNPVSLPQGVSATIAAGLVTIKGAKGSLSLPLGNGVTVTEQDKALQVAFDAADGARMRAGSSTASPRATSASSSWWASASALPSPARR
jgi:large subunit ribosomal protein L6